MNILRKLKDTIHEWGSCFVAKCGRQIRIALRRLLRFYRSLKSPVPVKNGSGLPPWRHSGVPQINFSVLARQGRVALSHWSEFLGGKTIPKNNRLERSIRAIEEFVDLFPNGSKLSICDRHRVAHIPDAVRTVFEAFVVAYTVTERGAQHRFMEKHFRAFLDGSDVEDPKNPSDARSHQFEAYVLAQLILGGTTAHGDEPDIVMEYHGESVGVAVKRLRTKNLNTLTKRVREGANQMVGEDGTILKRGFLAMSVDPWISWFDADDDAEVIGARFLKDLDPTARDTGRVLENRLHVRGLILIGTSIRWDFDGDRPRFVWKAPQFTVGFKDSDDDNISVQQFNTFFDGWSGRWENSLAELGEYLKSHA